MKNIILKKTESSVKILLEGKNVNNYIKRIIKEDIEIYSLEYINYNKAYIILKYKDYLKLKDNRTIYKLSIINKYGKLKILTIIKKNYILLISLLIGLLSIIFLSNIIFDVEIVHTNKEIITLLENELEKYNIKKYKMKKKYSDIKIIKDKILENNKEKIEWLEIENIGTKYIIRVEERKIKENNIDNKYQDIVALKSGVLKKIFAISGEKTKEINTYVKKNDTVISGRITKPNGEEILTKAEGQIFMEVWYTIDVEYPYHYKEEIPTGNKKNVYYINFINKRIGLFDFNKFNTFNNSKKIILYNNILPISLVKEKQYELNVIDEIYTEEQVINKAIEKAEDKLLNSNNLIEKIDKVSIINKIDDDDKIKIKLFVSVIENVTSYKEINENE